MLGGPQAILPHNVDPLLINPLLLNEEYNRDPSLKALKRRVFLNQGSTLRIP